MKILYKIVITAILVLLISKFLPDVRVASFKTSIIVAVVLGLLNIFIKPLLVLFTLPITIFTLGIFLLIINAIIIVVCDQIVGGFEIASFWTAFVFSLALSFSQSITYAIFIPKD